MSTKCCKGRAADLSAKLTWVGIDGLDFIRWKMIWVRIECRLELNGFSMIVCLNKYGVQKSSLNLSFFL